MSKCSGINVGSIEEDIRNLEKYIELVIDKNYCDCNELNIICYGKYADGSKNVANSIQNILQDYTRQKQINEEHQKINSELMKAINTVEKEKGDWIEECKKLREYIFIAPNLDEITAIKYASIQEEAYIRGKAEEQKRASQIIHENYIPKQKIKDKIEELKNEKEQLRIDKNVTWDSQIYKIDLKIQVLQELLQEEDK